jgi:hypothetical protein
MMLCKVIDRHGDDPDTFARIFIDLEDYNSSPVLKEWFN